MHPTICNRCKKNVAVIFVTKVENGVSSNEGLCLKCARELKIKPVEDLMQKMNLTDEDLDNLTDEMMEAMSTIDGSLMPRDDQPDGEEDDGSRTATFPFLNRLFGGGQGDSGEKPGGCMWPGMPGCRLTAAVPLPLRRRKPPVPQESRSSMCPP